MSGYFQADKDPRRRQRLQRRPLQPLRQRLRLRRQRHLRQRLPQLQQRLRDLLLLRGLFPRQGGGPLPCRDLSCSRDRRSWQQSQRWIGFSEVDGKTLAECARSGGGAAITISTRGGQRVPPTDVRSVCENAFTLGELLRALQIKKGSYRRQRTKRRTTSLPSFPSVKKNLWKDELPRLQRSENKFSTTRRFAITDSASEAIEIRES